MKSLRSGQMLTAVLLFLLLPCQAKAHLGIVQAREVQGRFVITLFTSSELVRGRAADVSVMVQRRDSNQAILDATVSFVLTPPRGSVLDRTEPMCGLPTALGTTLGSQDGQAIIPAQREQSANKLLYAAPLNFPLAGLWKLETLVNQGADSAKLTCEIPVGLPARRFIGLVPYLALPLLVMAVFAMNQWLRSR